MKKFRIQISAYQMYADFNIQSLNGPLDIENAIIDKLGENVIVWEKTGMFGPLNRITYEEVIDGEHDATSKRPLHSEEGSGSRMGAGAS